jgi:hypothetical protein
MITRADRLAFFPVAAQNLSQLEALLGGDGAAVPYGPPTGGRTGERQILPSEPAPLTFVDSPAPTGSTTGTRGTAQPAWRFVY